jgi:hypothetical protein
MRKSTRIGKQWQRYRELMGIDPDSKAAKLDFYYGAVVGFTTFHRVMANKKLTVEKKASVLNSIRAELGRHRDWVQTLINLKAEKNERRYGDS